jgi:serine/threonine protein kinase
LFAIVQIRSRSQLSLTAAKYSKTPKSPQKAPKDGPLSRTIRDLDPFSQFSEKWHANCTFYPFGAATWMNRQEAEQDEEGYMSITAQIGPFKVVSPIANGGMAGVYLARHERNGRSVAIKALPEEFLADQKRSQSLEREVQIAKKLRHENVIRTFGLCRHEGVAYLVMEYLGGGNLREYITRHDLSLADTLGVVAQICEGLRYIHRHKLDDGRIHGIIHRDIKPENILLSKGGRVKVADFGLSFPEKSRFMREKKNRAGTLFYMSPEQILRMPLDTRTDIYSLGVVIYELLTSHLPHEAKDKSEFVKRVTSDRGMISPPSSINDNVPPQLDRIVLKALRRDPDERYGTVSELADALRRISGLLAPDEMVDQFNFMREVRLSGVIIKTSEIIPPDSDESVEEPDGETAGETAEESPQESSLESAGEPAGESAGESAGEPAGEPAGETAGESGTDESPPCAPPPRNGDSKDMPSESHIELAETGDISSGIVSEDSEDEPSVPIETQVAADQSIGDDPSPGGAHDMPPEWERAGPGRALAMIGEMEDYAAALVECDAKHDDAENFDIEDIIFIGRDKG